MAHNKMSPCDAIEARLTDFPDLRDETRIELERHAETCQSCRAKLAEYRALMAALRNFEALFEELETRVRRLPGMCPEVRGKRTAPSTPSSGHQIRRQPPRV